MNVDAAAQALVRTAVRDWFKNRLPSPARREDAAARIKLARCEIDRAIRHQLGIVTHDLDGLIDAVRQTVPEDRRTPLIAALTALVNAQAQELVVREHVAFAIGLALGQLHSAVNSPDPPPRQPKEQQVPVHWPWTVHGERLRRSQLDGPRTARREDVAFIGRLLRARRRAAGMSPDDLARKAGVGAGTTRKVERGFNVKIATIARLASAFEPPLIRVFVEMLTMPTFQRRALTECRRAEVELRKVSDEIAALLR